MKLDILLKGIEYHLQQGSPENCEITGLCEDSRKIKCGNLIFLPHWNTYKWKTISAAGTIFRCGRSYL